MNVFQRQNSPPVPRDCLSEGLQQHAELGCRTYRTEIRWIHWVFIGLPYMGKGPLAHSTWWEAWDLWSGHLTPHIRNTFTLKMHFPICAVIFYLTSSFRDIHCCMHINTKKTIKKKRLRKGIWGDRTELERHNENQQKALILITDGERFFFFFYSDIRKFLFR